MAENVIPEFVLGTLDLNTAKRFGNLTAQSASSQLAFRLNKETDFMLPDNDVYCHDLTAILIALEIVNDISDPIGRYQALHTMANGFGVNYAQFSHLYAIYCTGV